MNEFERSLAKVLVHEGGYVHDPRDPGGETNQGVTRVVYDDYRRTYGLKSQSVKLMTEAERSSIYRMRYWSLSKADQMPPGLGYVVFDGSVHSGVSQSAKWLQRALGVKADGLVGPATLAAIRSHPNIPTLIDAICDRRLLFLKALKTWKTYGRGWASRVAGVRQVGKAWASNADTPRVTLVTDTQAKARIEDAKTAPTKGIADAATGGGVGSGALAATLQQVQEQLTPFSAGSALIGHVVAGLVIATGALTIGGLAYRWYATRKKAELADALDKVPV